MAVLLALITGASAGIGKEFARQLARRRYDVIVTARRAERLDSLSAELEKDCGVRAHVFAADLSREDDCRRLHAWTREQGLAVDLLVNNAGFGAVGPSEKTPIQRETEMIRLNVEAVHSLSRLFLSDMLARGGTGAILNVASTAAFQPIPYMAVYAATKAFVLSFSEALAGELEGTGIRVMALCPGVTRTEFGRVAGIPESGGKPAMDASDVVSLALRALDEGRVVAIPGGFNATLALASKLAPRPLVRRGAARVMRRAFGFARPFPPDGDTQ